MGAPRLAIVTLALAALALAGCDSLLDSSKPLRTVTIEFRGTGQGSVSSDPAGLSCASQDPTPCSGEFEEGALVKLTATPGHGFAFESWGAMASLGPSPLLELGLLGDTTVHLYFDDPALAPGFLSPGNSQLHSRDYVLSILVPDAAVSAHHDASVRTVTATALGPAWAAVVAAGAISDAYLIQPAGLQLADTALVRLVSAQSPNDEPGTTRVRLEPAFVDLGGGVQPLPGLRIWAERGSATTFGGLTALGDIARLEPWDGVELALSGVPATVSGDVDVTVTLTTSPEAAVSAAGYYDFSLLLLEQPLSGTLETDDGLVFQRVLRYSCPTFDLPAHAITVTVDAWVTLPGTTTPHHVRLTAHHDTSCP